MNDDYNTSVTRDTSTGEYHRKFQRRPTRRPYDHDLDLELTKALHAITHANRAMISQVDAQTKSARRSKWIFAAFLFGPMLLMIAFGIINNPTRKAHVAVVEIDGIIMSGSPAGSEAIIPKLERAMNNKHSLGAILQLSSPGGSPVQSNAIRQSMVALREKYPEKKIVVAAEDVMASGGYLIALGADEIYADRSSIVGSVGSIAQMFNFTDAMNKVGVKQYVYTSGEMKSSMSPFAEPKDYQVERMEKMLVGIHDIFTESVLEVRDVDPSDLDGSYWLADEALEKGFIDGISNTRALAGDVFGTDKLVYQRSIEDLFAGRAKVLGQSFMNGFIHSIQSSLTQQK